MLEAEKEFTLPWDYRTSLTRGVYGVLRVVDPDYSSWLHEQGFRWQKRTYRLFVYSDLMPTKWELSPMGLTNVRWLTWEIGSPDCKFGEKFLEGLKWSSFRLELFGVSLEIVDIVRIEVPELGGGMVFRTISPVAVSMGMSGRRHPTYLHPNQPEFVENLQRNLITKWQAFHQRKWNGSEFGIRVWKPRQKLIRVFDVNVKAWYLQLQMWGSEELIRFAYNAGLGIKNSQGFGMIEPWR